MNQDNVRWLMQDEHRDCLLDRGKLRLSEWLEKGSASVVKQGPHRTVYEVRLPSLHFFLKHNHSTGTKAKLRRWVRKSKARIEHDCALEVARREVPTFTPLALGESSGSHNSGESYLLTHALKDTHSLSHFLEQDLPTFPESTRTHWRQSIAIELGKLLAKMHNTGILHRDLHPANILIQFIDGKPKLFLIDLDAVQLRSSLDWKSRAANLVILNRWFILRSSRSDRLRFWRAYSGDKTNREGALDIELDTEISNQRFWRSLDPRCIKKNRRFRPLKASGVVGHTVTDMDEKVLADLLANPDAPFEDERNRVLKDSKTSTVVEMEIPLAGKTQRVIYKRFNVKRWTAPLASLIRTTPAMRSWIYGHGLRQRWIPTPRPLVVLHRRRNGMLHEGYLMTAKLEPTEELNDFADRVEKLANPERTTTIRHTIDQVASLIRELHRRQISQRDLKSANLLVVPDSLIGSSSEKPKRSHVSDAPSPIDYWPLTNSTIWMIDLVGVGCLKKLSKQRRIQNLARLHASFLSRDWLTRSDKLRFLRAYLPWGLRGKENWKLWWRAIESATGAKVAKNARSGRVLA